MPKSMNLVEKFRFMRWSLGSWLTVTVALLNSRRCSPLLDSFNWMHVSCKILSICFGSNSQLEKYWSEVLVKLVAIVNLWLWRSISLKGRSKVYIKYIYILYRFSVLPLLSTTIFYLVRALFHLLWNDIAPMMHCEFCYLQLSQINLENAGHRDLLR